MRRHGHAGYCVGPPFRLADQKARTCRVTSPGATNSGATCPAPVTISNRPSGTLRAARSASGRSSRASSRPASTRVGTCSRAKAGRRSGRCSMAGLHCPVLSRLVASAERLGNCCSAPRFRLGSAPPCEGVDHDRGQRFRPEHAEEVDQQSRPPPLGFGQGVRRRADGCQCPAPRRKALREGDSNRRGEPPNS